MATTREQAKAAREAKLDELHERLTGAVEQLVSGEDWTRALAFAARFRARSFSNTLLIWEQHQAAFEVGLVPEPFPSYVAGYRQWQGLGRQVQKGQPGYQILAPVTGRFATATPADAQSWRRLSKGERPRAGEVVRTRMVGVRPAYVWDVSQTQGDPIPEPPAPKLLEGQASAGLWDGLAGQVEAAGFSVLRVPHEGMIHGANGMTDYTANTVAVRENMDPAAQVKTLAHELGHVLLHGPDAEEARQHRGIGEVEAESVALMVGAAHGMDTSGYTIPYVSTWAARVDGKEPVEVVKATGERVRKTALTILDQLDTTQVGDGTPPGLDREATHRDTPAQAQAPPTAELASPRRTAPSLGPAARPAAVPAVEGRGL
ncbi:ArdC-like ssDNA-binding domain-containing protein [Brevibacterium picturae]|uniref:Serine/arginine repetitive matrix protein 2 n=1 Tax=Brevibacterium picturae TaxID=260553 RepID=A0ABN2BWP2_9MICO